MVTVTVCVRDLLMARVFISKNIRIPLHFFTCCPVFSCLLSSLCRPSGGVASQQGPFQGAGGWGGHSAAPGRGGGRAAVLPLQRHWQGNVCKQFRLGWTGSIDEPVCIALLCNLSLSLSFCLRLSFNPTHTPSTRLRN